jgi:co-chaperonin GroES (HSP10)
VQPGDVVLFSWQAGQELWIDEGRERLLILREEDLLAVVEP